MPQQKQEKRKTAIRLYKESIDMHVRAIPDCMLEKTVAVHKQRIANLQKHVVNTENKLEIGA